MKLIKKFNYKTYVVDFKYSGLGLTEWLWWKFKEWLWWKFKTGTVISVKWPSGPVVVGPNSRNWSGMGPAQELVDSADPNDHYRPTLEKLVGKQGRDWQWAMDRDDYERLAITFRRGKEFHATILALRWY